MNPGSSCGNLEVFVKIFFCGVRLHIAALFVRCGVGWWVVWILPVRTTLASLVLV